MYLFYVIGSTDVILEDRVYQKSEEGFSPPQITGRNLDPPGR